MYISIYLKLYELPKLASSTQCVNVSVSALHDITPTYPLGITKDAVTAGHGQTGSKVACHTDRQRDRQTVRQTDRQIPTGVYDALGFMKTQSTPPPESHQVTPTKTNRYTS